MFTNRKLNTFLIGVLAVAFVAALALVAVPSAAAPTLDTTAYADYYQRHSQANSLTVEEAIGSDWFERHASEISPASAPGYLDYFQRLSSQ